MGIDYTAKLFYGFKLGSSVTEELEEYDYEWQNWLADKLGVKLYSDEYDQLDKELQIAVERVGFLGEDTVYYFVIKDTRHSGDYDPTPIELRIPNPAILKKACEKLSIPYSDPSWYIAVHVW